MNGEQRLEMALAVARIDERTANTHKKVEDLCVEVAGLRSVVGGSAERIAALEEKARGASKGRAMLWFLLGGLFMAVVSEALLKVIWE